MFGKLTRLVDNARTLNANRVIANIFLDQRFQEFVLDLNRVDQIFEGGIQADGSDINSSNSSPGTYSRFTEQENQGRTFRFNKSTTKAKIAGDAYFLFNTGRLFDSFKIDVFNDSFDILAADTLDDGKSVLGEYGSNLLGLTPASIEILIEALNERVIPSILERLAA